MRTILAIGWLDLRRDPVALAFVFVLPVLFFSVFALVFGGLDGGASRPVPTVLVLEGRGAVQGAFAEKLEAHPGVDLVGGPDADRQQALALVRAGMATAAVVVPRGFGAAAAGVSGSDGRDADLEILADKAKPVAVGIVEGAVRGTLLALWWEHLGPGPEATPADAGAVRVVDVLGAGEKRPSIAYFAAGIGVMFLLFAVTGRSGILIEERESGVLTRMLASGLSVRALLLGHWAFLSLLGAVQVTVMFLWGWLVFGLDLFTLPHLAGFVLVTAATAAAAAAFGLFLATLCRTRGQLDGVMVVVVLIMSALGGSMFPRFLMPAALEKAGLFTFNAWALDGYRKVFWYDAPPWGLAPELAVLVGAAAVFLALATVQARRALRA